MAVFVRVVEAGSFSEAARLLRTTPSTVSKAVVRLEQRLGVRLVARTTRRLALTKEGELYYERSRALLADLDETDRLVAQGGAEPEGVVRVSASVSFGTHALEPILPAFWEAFPKVVVDLSLSDEIVDLYLDRTDVAFRVGKLQPSSLVARKVGVARRAIVASPAYLARRGTPRKPEDLARHACLGFNFRRGAPVWPLHEGGKVVERKLTGPLLANNGETVKRLALAGAGLARLGRYHLREHLARGELVEVLRDGSLADSEEIHAVVPGARPPARVRAFLDFVVPRLRRAIKG